MSGAGLCLLLASLLSNPVTAQQNVPKQQNPNELNRNQPGREIRTNPQANGRINQRQAVTLARQKFEGNILRISLIGEGENQRYQIRMENEGKVFTVFVHATTGRVSGGN